MTFRIIIKQTFRVIYDNIFQISILFFINVIVNLFLLFFFSVISQMIYIYLLSLPISIYINTFLTLCIKASFDSVKKNQPIIKYIKHYLYGTLLLFLIYLLFLIILSIIIFIPVVKSLMFLLLIILILIYTLYFRFIPYIAILTESYHNLYKNTYILIKDYLLLSTQIFFLFGIGMCIFYTLQYNTFNTYTETGNHFFYFLLFFTIYQTITFLSIITDITLITLLFKKK